MKSKATIGPVLVCVLGITATGFSSACAQNALGGAKAQQNKLGGVAKPAPAIGGAIKPVSPPSPPKPAPVVGMAKPTSPVTPPNKGGTVVTSSNLKCASGACTSRGPKP